MRYVTQVTFKERDCMSHTLRYLKWISLFWLPYAAALHAAEVLGAGASLPAPVYAKWAQAYQKATGNKIVYQSIGSGNGVTQIIAKSIDFGASDIPLSMISLEKDGLVQFPTVIGGVVPIVNLPNIKTDTLKLSGPVLADIYLGKIVKWNDSAITRLNSGISLPDLAIAVIHRSDGAGSTFLLTNYLSKVDVNWKTRVGEGTTVAWPTGLGGKGDEGVTAFVQRLPGAIGYVDFSYAQAKKLPGLQMQNQSGVFVAPNEASMRAAAASSHWENSAFSEILTEQSAKEAWPLTGATFVLMRKVQDKPAQGTEVLKFFEWVYKNGSHLVAEANYVPLPDVTVQHVKNQWKLVRDTSGKTLLE